MLRVMRSVLGWIKIVFVLAVSMGLIWVGFTLAGAGIVRIAWADYTITTPLWVIILLTTLLIISLLTIYALIFWLLSLPETWHRVRVRAGHKALYKGLAAVAAGNARKATRLAGQAGARLGDKEGLCLLLKAQAARLSGQEAEAKGHFTALVEAGGEGAVFGLRGLIQDALTRGDEAGALTLARQAATKMPGREGWAPRVLYDLLIRARAWDEVWAMAPKILPPKEAASDRRAIDLLLAKDDPKPLKRLMRAVRVDVGFPPAACALAAHYVREGRASAAAKVIETAWKIAPHPDLIPLWEAAAPSGKAGAPVRWAQRLADSVPNDVESYLLLARAEQIAGLWGQARAHLEAAQALEQTQRIYTAQADLAEIFGVGQGSEYQHQTEVLALRMRANSAPPSKAWVCQITGHVYDKWSSLAEPQGRFNTMVWQEPKGLPLHVVSPLYLDAPSIVELEVSGQRVL